MEKCHSEHEMVLVRKFFCIGLRTTSQIVGWLDIIGSIVAGIMLAAIAVNWTEILRIMREASGDAVPQNKNEEAEKVAIEIVKGKGAYFDSEESV